MRLWAAIQTDLLLQARNQLYAISAVVSLVVGGALVWLSPPDLVVRTVPMAVLMFVGGSTLLYVVAMIILEKDDGTLTAICVTPLRSWEYLAAKVATLAALATFEGVLLVGLALAWFARDPTLIWPSPLSLVGLVVLAVIHVLIGIVLVVRHERLMTVLLPMSAVAMTLQIPAFYFLGVLDTPLLLLIPSGPPALLIQGGFRSLQGWEWVVGGGGSLVLWVGLWRWARAAFETYVVQQGGR